MAKPGYKLVSKKKLTHSTYMDDKGNTYTEVKEGRKVVPLVYKKSFRAYSVRGM